VALFQKEQSVCPIIHKDVSSVLFLTSTNIENSSSHLCYHEQRDKLEDKRSDTSIPLDLVWHQNI